MKINIIYKITFVFISSTLFFGCTPKNNFDIDLSNLPRPKAVTTTNKENHTSIEPENKSYIKDLVSLKDKEQILSQFELGKKDPFSKSDIPSNQLSSNLKVKGFLNTEVRNLLCQIFRNQGKISEKSVGE